MTRRVRGPWIAPLASIALLAACGGPAPSAAPPVPAPSDTPAPTAVADPGVPGPAQAVDTEGRFRLVLGLAAVIVRAGEPVEGQAALTTVDGQEAAIAGSGGGVIGYSFTEIGGPRSMGGVMTSDCAPHTIPAGGALRSPLRPSAAWSEDDPNAAFYRAFAQRPDVRLPPGAWRITAHAQFLGAGCTRPLHRLEVSTVVLVTP